MWFKFRSRRDEKKYGGNGGIAIVTRREEGDSRFAGIFLRRSAGLGRRSQSAVPLRVAILDSQVTFVRLKSSSGSDAVLIADKNPFEEDHAFFTAMLNESSLERIMRNDVYHSYNLLMPSHLNGDWCTVACG